MKRFFQAPWRFAACYAALLLAVFSWALLDTFVIPRREALLSRALDAADKVLETLAPNATAQPAPVVTATSYQDGSVSVEIDAIRRDGTTCYVADVRLAAPSLLQTALAEDTFGRNLRQTVSDMARDKNAILAINGDYYGSRKSGWCLRNGVLYREGPASSATELLLIDQAGDFSIASDRGMAAADADGLWQIFRGGARQSQQSAHSHWTDWAAALCACGVRRTHGGKRGPLAGAAGRADARRGLPYGLQSGWRRLVHHGIHGRGGQQAYYQRQRHYRAGGERHCLYRHLSPV